MADIASNLRTFLLDDASIAGVVGDRVHHNHVPMAIAKPYIWLRRRNTNHIVCTDDAAGQAPDDYSFDVEAIARDANTADTLGDYIRSRCHCYRGAVGDATAKGVFVTDQGDDYIAQGNGGDQGLTVIALDVQVHV